MKAVGSSRVEAEYENFNNYMHNMPLAPGFVHAFEVRAYVGSPGESDFKQGPKSERLLLRGDSVACDYVSGADVENIHRLYDCGPRSPAGMGYEDDEFRPGLLALTGTDICRDIFSSTPAKFTWDNPVVKQVWWLVWIIAGGVLFTLLVWQGLRMTYDIWLDPQPATGFRELVPRFLLSVALAAGSLVICRMVLVLASDLTCFVAQYTGMSMWGVIGATFANLGIGIGAWFMGLFTLDDGRHGHTQQLRPVAGHREHDNYCFSLRALHFLQGHAGDADQARVAGGPRCVVPVGLCILRLGRHGPLDEEMGEHVPGSHIPAGGGAGGDLHRHWHHGGFPEVGG